MAGNAQIVRAGISCLALTILCGGGAFIAVRGCARRIDSTVEKMETGTPPSLEAAALPARLAIGADRVAVTNADADAWQRITIRINQAFTLKMERLDAGEERHLDLREFTNKEGQRFDARTHKVLELGISADVAGERRHAAFAFE